MHYSLPGSSVHGIFQARILEWVAISFSSGSSQPRDRTQVSCIAGTLYHLSHQGINPQNVMYPYKRILLLWLFNCSVVSDSVPMDCSTPGFPIHHQLPELAQTHVHRVGDAIVPFSSCLQSFPESGSFPVSQFFASGGQRTGASASASVLPVNIQD